MTDLPNLDTATTSQPAPLPPVQPEIIVPPPVGTSSPRYPLLLGLLALFLVAAGIVWGMGWWPSNTTQPTSLLIETSPAPELNPRSTPESTTQMDRIIFKQADELWLYVPTGEHQQLTQTNHGVYSFALSPDKKWATYIQGTKVTNENNYSYIDPVSVQLLNLETLATQEIFNQPKSAPFPKEFTEYEIALKAVHFADDSQMLAITTSDSLLTYDLTQNVLTPIFTLPYKPENRGGGIYSFYEPRFSPDKTKISLLAGFYEGATNKLVDLKTGQLTDLPYTYYTSGKKVLGWIDNQAILVVEYESEHIADNPAFSFLAVSVPDLTERVLLSSQKSFSHQALVENGVMYYLMWQNENQGEVGETPDPTAAPTFTVEKMNLVTGENQVLSSHSAQFDDYKVFILRPVSASRSTLVFEGTKEYPNNFPGTDSRYINSIFLLDLQTGTFTDLGANEVMR